jgi:hypothetical protein
MRNFEIHVMRDIPGVMGKGYAKSFSNEREAIQVYLKYDGYVSMLCDGYIISEREISEMIAGNMIVIGG